LKVCL